jgi:AraC-like DNA-binding protein
MGAIPNGFFGCTFHKHRLHLPYQPGNSFCDAIRNERYEIRSHSFLPRNKNLICHHSAGNRIFGIKFKVSPVLLEKEISFSEYNEYMFPLSYLIVSKIIDRLKGAGSFAKRIDIIYAYYDRIIEKHVGARKSVDIVTQILDDCHQQNDISVSIEELSSKYNISSRTLQRYFETTTSISSTQALQIMRIRKAVEHLTTTPSGFNFRTYGYYDYSHFTNI